VEDLELVELVAQVKHATARASATQTRRSWPGRFSRPLTTKLGAFLVCLPDLPLNAGEGVGLGRGLGVADLDFPFVTSASGGGEAMTRGGTMEPTDAGTGAGACIGGTGFSDSFAGVSFRLDRDNAD